MGAFVGNFHVRSEDDATVRRTVAETGASQVRVGNPKNGWISIYEQRASTQDEEWIARFADELSARLATVCVAFLVHDSDIVRYWLSDEGKMLDEYNSIPDYFNEVSAAERRRVRGRADVFLRYCKPGVTRQQVENVLRAGVTFGEDTVQELAEFLGIDPDRAQDDFIHSETGGDSGGLRCFAGDDDDAADEDGGGAMSSPSGLGKTIEKFQQHFAGMFASTTDQDTSPESNALVKAAASGNIAEIERIVGSGTDINALGLLPLHGAGGESVFGKTGLAPTMALSPLMVAASRGQAPAVQRLLELGANVTENHLICGSALHVAAQAGSPETVRVLLGAGSSPGQKNRQGQTPRALIQAMRSQIEMTKQMAKTMPQLQQVYDKLAAKLAEMPEAGWAECEVLLSQAGG